MIREINGRKLQLRRPKPSKVIEMEEEYTRQDGGIDQVKQYEILLRELVRGEDGNDITLDDFGDSVMEIDEIMEEVKKFAFHERVEEDLKVVTQCIPVPHALDMRTNWTKSDGTQDIGKMFKMVNEHLIIQPTYRDIDDYKSFGDLKYAVNEAATKQYGTKKKNKK